MNQEPDYFLRNRNWIENNKHERPFAAGALAYIVGYQCVYGCHFGTRSSRHFCCEQFAKGWHEAHFDEFHLVMSS